MARTKASAIARRSADEKRKRELKTGQRELVLQPPELPTDYDDHILARAVEYQQVTGQYPFNPRCLTPLTILDIDLEFIHNLEAYKEWEQFFYDMAERPESMK